MDKRFIQNSRKQNAFNVAKYTYFIVRIRFDITIKF